MEMIPRERFDDLLFWLLKEIHQFECHDVALFGISWHDMHVLKYLRGNPECRVSDIAEELQLPLFKVSRLLNGLGDKGYISRDKNALDKRNTWVSLTAQGKTFIRDIQKYHYQLIIGSLETMAPAEAEEIVRVVTSIIDMMRRDSPFDISKTKPRIKTRREDAYGWRG